VERARRPSSIARRCRHRIARGPVIAELQAQDPLVARKAHVHASELRVLADWFHEEVNELLSLSRSTPAVLGPVSEDLHDQAMSVASPAAHAVDGGPPPLAYPATSNFEPLGLHGHVTAGKEAACVPERGPPMLSSWLFRRRRSSCARGTDSTSSRRKAAERGQV